MKNLETVYDMDLKSCCYLGAAVVMVIVLLLQEVLHLFKKFLISSLKAALKLL